MDGVAHLDTDSPALQLPAESGAGQEQGEEADVQDEAETRDTFDCRADLRRETISKGTDVNHTFLHKMSHQ